MAKYMPFWLRSPSKATYTSACMSTIANISRASISNTGYPDAQDVSCTIECPDGGSRIDPVADTTEQAIEIAGMVPAADSDNGREHDVDNAEALIC